MNKVYIVVFGVCIGFTFTCDSCKSSSSGKSSEIKSAPRNNELDEVRNIFFKCYKCSDGGIEVEKIGKSIGEIESNLTIEEKNLDRFYHKKGCLHVWI